MDWTREGGVTQKYPGCDTDIRMIVNISYIICLIFFEFYFSYFHRYYYFSYFIDSLNILIIIIVVCDIAINKRNKTF